MKTHYTQYRVARVFETGWATAAHVPGFGDSDLAQIIYNRHVKAHPNEVFVLQTREVELSPWRAQP